MCCYTKSEQPNTHICSRSRQSKHQRAHQEDDDEEENNQST